MTSPAPDDELRSISVKLSLRDLIRLEREAKRARRLPREQAARWIERALDEAEAKLESVA